MSSKKDRIPLPPIDAKKSLMTCHFCIVGCGYHVYKWEAGREGGRAPHENALGLDFRTQLAPLATTMTPAMHTVIADKDGRSHNVLVSPDKECSVNQGLSSTRGGQMASIFYTPDGAGANRLRYPSVFTGDDRVDTNWQQAMAVYAGVAKRLLDEHGPDPIMFNCFDHGGAGGGFENTWGTGKLMFSALQTKMVRIHNRPAYNSECHASRDMGVGELNNSYEDAGVADVILSIGANAYETQTNYFLAHWIPNLTGATVDKKKEWFPGESAGRGRIIFVDPRRSLTVSVAEGAAGKENVLHLQIEPGTDTALYNGLLTYVVDQGWHDKDFIAQHTTGFDAALKANRMSLEETSKITGVSVADIKKAAQWAYQPKASGHRLRTMHGYEKGIIWGNDNYRIQSSLVDLCLATHNVGRRGTGVVRLGGHQEGYARPPYPGPRPAPYIDQEIINGNGKMLTVWACNSFQTTLNAEQYREVVIRRSNVVKEALAKARGATADELVDVIYDAVENRGGLFVTVIDLYPTKFAEAAHLVLPAAHPGEMNLTSMNGERRMRLSEKFMEPPGEAKADCLIAADIANAIKALYEKEDNAAMTKRFSGFDWQTEEDAFNDGFRKPEGIDSQGGGTGHMVTYERLRAMGNNGVQLPVKEYKDGKLVGTPMIYADYKFSTSDGKAHFQPSPWNGLPAPVAAQKRKHRFWINNGRANHIWQTAYHDRHIDFRRKRYPMAPIELNPEDAREFGIEAGDIVEVYNDYGSTFAMAYPDPDIQRAHTFMVFAYWNGIAGDVVTEWTDRNVVPYYKGTWASLRKVGSMDDYKKTVSFKRRRWV
ncbi:MAG: arsenate reductase (azurin) large subunit [Gammaproteobacteria bacterium]|nr:arsenate reductase (azurin) large subunit [Gammaproteobacteria bacterium]